MNKHQFKKITQDWFNSKPSHLYIVIGILSAVVFCSIYGTKLLIPTYTDWLLAGGDLSQHYLGWKAYRASAWHFPIGLIDNLTYPSQVSVIFTDSIPIFAVLFKILSPVLPENFQYFGLWGICCFILTGILTARIIKKFIKNPGAIIISSIIFTYTPVMIWRMYAHTSLAGQWLMLLSLEPIFCYEKYREKPKKLYAFVAMIGILVPSIHIYYVLMCGFVMIGLCFTIIASQKKIVRAIGIIACYAACIIGNIALLGGLSSGVTADGGGLGAYSMNLNGFFNPQGWSCIFATLPLYGNGQYEGFAYLGAGWIFLSVLSVLVFLGSGRAKELLKKYGVTIISLLIIVVLSMAFALSPVVTLNDEILVSLELPQTLTKYMSVFRSSGRISWAAIYVIMLLSVILIYKFFDRRTALILLSAGLILQVYDIHDTLLQRRERFSKEYVYDSLLDNTEFWNAVATDEEIMHVVYYSSPDLSVMYSITDWALDNDITTNTFYLARTNNEAVDSARETALAELPEDTIFIFNPSETLSCTNYSLDYYSIDDLIVGCPKEIGGFEKIPEKDFYSEYSLGTDLSFIGDEYNASGYIMSGLSDGGSGGTWTVGYEFNMAFVTDSDADMLHGDIECSVFNGSQSVIIYVNDEKVYENPDFTGGNIAFDFDNPGAGKPVKIRIEIPTANSPSAIGQSGDTRILGLGFKHMVFSEK